MAVQTKVGSFKAGTTNANVTVAVGFTPQVFIMWAGGRTDNASASGRATIESIIGAFVHLSSSTPTGASVAETADDNLAVSTFPFFGYYGNAGWRQILGNEGGYGPDANWTVNTWASNMILSKNGTVPAHNFTIHYLAIGGLADASITNIVTQLFEPATLGSHSFQFGDSVTGNPFTPDGMIFIGGNINGNSQTDDGASLYIGFCDANLNMAVVGGSTNNGASSSLTTGSYGTTGDAMAMADGHTAPLPMDLEFRVTSFDGATSGVGGATLNWIHRNTGASSYPRNIIAIGLKGSNSVCGSFSTKTDGSEITLSPAMKPKAVILASHMKTQSTLGTIQAQADNTLSIGIADSNLNAGCHSWRNVETASGGTSDSATSIDFANSYINVNAAGAVQGALVVDTMAEGSVTMHMATPDNQANFVAYFALGDPPTPHFDRSHNLDAFIASDATEPIPFVVASGQLSGNPFSGPVTGLSLSGLQQGDLIVGFLHWSQPSSAVLPTMLDNLGNDVYFIIGQSQSGANFLSGSQGGDVHMVAYTSVIMTNPSGPVSFSIGQDPSIQFPVDMIVFAIRNANTKSIVQQGIGGVGPNQSNFMNPFGGARWQGATGINMSSGSLPTTVPFSLAIGAAATASAAGIALAQSGWTIAQAITQPGGTGLLPSSFVGADPVIPALGTQVSAQFSQSGPVDWIAMLVIIGPFQPGAHFIDAFLFPVFEQAVQLATQLIPHMNPNAFVNLATNLATPALDFLQTGVILQSKVLDFVNLNVTLAQKATPSYVKTAVQLMLGGSPSHHIDAVLTLQNLGFVKTGVTLIQSLVATGCDGSYPDIAFVKFQVWLVAPGNNSHQAPGTALTLADDWLSQQDALAAYQVIGRFVLDGVPLIVTGFTAGVMSWQTRTRQWLRLVDFEPGGVVINQRSSNRQLPNGQVINTTTQVEQIQDTTVTTVTTTYSNQKNRVSKTITEVTKGGQSTTREQDIETINGIQHIVEKKTVTSSPPFKDNVQPIKVLTLDGVEHYQFFGPANPHWAGGEAEGTTETDRAVQIIPSMLNGSSVDSFGNPILARVTDEKVTTPDGKVIQTHTEDVGIRDAGTTTIDTQSSFNGIQTTVKTITTFPDGSQSVSTKVTNNITGDSTTTTVDTTTDENGLLIVTTTVEETTTFQDPVSGNLRTQIATTKTIVGPTGTTVDNTTETRNNFEDDLISAKIKVYLVQEFTVTCILDRFSKEQLEEVAVDHQRNFAIAELIGQQLGNMDLSWLLRNNLIGQFNQAINCIAPMPFQALGKTYEVVFAPSASCFRAKYIPGTMPAVYELQMILQQRSDLITGLRGF